MRHWVGLFAAYRETMTAGNPLELDKVDLGVLNTNPIQKLTN
jgi:hypothetical protein